MNGEPTVQLPAQYSTVAPQVDWLYYFLYWMSVVLFVGIVGTMCYFVWKYRRRPGVKAEPTGHNSALEIGWTFAPLVVLALLFHWGFQGYTALTVAPANAMEIRVRAYKWGWEFRYPNGATEPRTLHVPVNTPIRLVMSSDDVLHAFYVPTMRVKRDVVPGYYAMTWFEATRTTPAVPAGLQGDDLERWLSTDGNSLDLFCAEYCGAPEGGGSPGAYGHSTMRGHVVVESREAYEAHIASLFRRPDGLTEEQWGQRLYAQFNCNTCHSVNGAAGQGPTWRGLWGRQEQLTDRTSVTVDENYLRESILQPQARIVRGYQPVMPRAGLNDLQINAIIAYIRSLQ